jgi:hypothetical protein
VRARWSLIVIILLGGLAVLASYLWGVLARPDAAQILWGGVPGRIRSYYTVNMLLAAAGFFPFTFYILFRLNPHTTGLGGRYGYSLFAWLYAAILIPSALWLPLVYGAVEQSSQAGLWVVRAALILVGAASLGILAALLKIRPQKAGLAYWLAFVGSIFFCIQTVLLDAIVWGAFFRL